MSRELKRVPLDFDWPQKQIWYGYRLSTCREDKCDDCRKFARIKDIPITDFDCPDFNRFLGPPTGDGYQLWETTSEGSPVSPVFHTLDGLCEWCESNATVFAKEKTTKEKWKEMLEADFVYLQKEGCIFI